MSFQDFGDISNNIKTNGFKDTFFNTPTIDTDTITKYNQDIKTGVNAQKALASASQGTNKATTALMESANGAVVSTESLTAAQKTSTLAAKAQSFALKAASAAGNMIVFTLISKGIELAATAIDNWVHRVENANEKMNESLSSYEETKSELNNITSQLDEHNKRIKELQAKGSLTYAEQNELENLQAITKELLTQQNIKEHETQKMSKEAANDTVESYNTQFGDNEISKDNVNEGLDQMEISGNTSVTSDENDVVGNISEYVKFNQLLDETKQKLSNTEGLSQDEIKWLEEDYQDYFDHISYLRDDVLLGTNLSDLEAHKSALQDEFNRVSKKQKDGKELTSDESDTLSTYKELSDIIKLIYEYTNPQDWNSIQMSDIFNTKGIEKTQDELIEMEKAGTLSPEVLEGYSNLNNAISNSDIILGDAKSKAEAFCNSISALADVESQEPIVISTVQGFLNTATSTSKDENGDITTDSVVNDDIDLYQQKQANLEKYLQLLNNGTYTDSDLIDLAQEFGITGDSVDNLKIQISELMDSNLEELHTLLEGILDGADVDEGTREKVENLIGAIDNAADSAKKFDPLSSLDNMSGKFDKINSAYNEFLEGGKDNITADSMLGVVNAFKDMEGIDIDSFIKVLTSADSTANDVDNAFNGLSTQFIHTSGCLNNLTDDTAGLIVKFLEQNGIANANTIVMEHLNTQKQIAALESSNLSYATGEEINQLVTEGQVTNATALCIARYALQKQLANGTTLTTNGDISNIISLVKYLGGATSSLIAFQNAKNGLKVDQYDIHTKKYIYKENIVPGQKSTMDILKDAQSEINSVLNTTSPSGLAGNYSGKNSNSSGSSPEQTANVTIEKFNFIERLLNKLSDSFDKLKHKGENTFSSFTSRTKSYSSALKNISSQINAQASAYDAYMARANTVGLEGYWADQVQNGSLNIADITDDGLKQRIRDYQEWYEKAKDCKDKVEELKNTQTEMTQSKIELLITKYDKLASKVKSTNSRIENKIDLKEAFGSYASSGDYTNLNKNNRTQIKYINEQIKHYKSLQKTVTKNSEKWLEYKKEIDSSNESIQDLTKSITENAQALAELAGTKAKAKIETYDSADDLWKAKIENSSNYKTQNKYINEEVKNINKRQTTYNSAVKADKSGIASSGKAINKVKSTKQNKSLLKDVKSCIKKKEEIPASLLLAASKLDDNNSFYQKCIQYNAYVAAYQMDKATADLYKQESVQDKADKASQKQSNIETYYSNRQGVYDQKATKINNAIDLSSAKGHQVSTKYYGKLISNEKKNNTSLKEEKQKLISSLTGSVKNGSIKKYSDEWYQLCQQIDDVTNAMDESNKLLVEYENQIRQIKWDNFDYLENHIKNITSELDFMINELSREDLASDDTGGLTDRGNAVATLHASKYTTYLQQAKDYENEINKIEQELAKSPFDKTLLERKQELIASYQEAASGAQDEKYAIIELYSQGYDALSNKISDLISEYEDLLDAEKNAYDYQNNIADKAKEISTIRKQLEAYAGDASEETRAKVQSLNVSLADAERDLKDTQYDKFISDTKDMLSDLQSDFDENIQEIIDSMSQNFDSLMEKIESELGNTSETIKNSMDEISYKSTEEFSSLLDGTSIVKSTMEMISDTKNFHSKMESYVDGIAKSLEVTTASTEVNKKIQSDGAKTLGKDTADAKKEYGDTQKKYDVQKKIYEEAKLKKDRAHERYKYTLDKYGKNNFRTQNAKSDYIIARDNYNNIKSTYISQKSDYEYAKKRSTVLNYLSKHLDIATDSRGSYSDLNKAFYDEYGQRVLTSSEIKELAQKLKLTYDNQKSSGTLYKKLKEIGISGFKVGSRKIPYDQLAFLGEGKNEIQFDKNQGVLREVGQGDKIFTASMAENLWKLAQDPGAIINHGNLSPITPKFMKHIGGDVSVDIGDIVMHDVNNPEQFATQLVDAMNRNTKIRKILVNNTVGTLSKNYNSLSGRRF